MTTVSSRLGASFLLVHKRAKLGICVSPENRPQFKNCMIFGLGVDNCSLYFPQGDFCSKIESILSWKTTLHSLYDHKVHMYVSPVC